MGVADACLVRMTAMTTRSYSGLRARLRQEAAFLANCHRLTDSKSLTDRSLRLIKSCPRSIDFRVSASANTFQHRC
jgi:hypothetical protein